MGGGWGWSGVWGGWGGVGGRRRTLQVIACRMGTKVSWCTSGASWGIAVMVGTTKLPGRSDRTRPPYRMLPPCRTARPFRYHVSFARQTGATGHTDLFGDGLDRTAVVLDGALGVQRPAQRVRCGSVKRAQEENTCQRLGARKRWECGARYTYVQAGRRSAPACRRA